MLLQILSIDGIESTVLFDVISAVWPPSNCISVAHALALFILIKIFDINYMTFRMNILFLYLSKNLFIL